MASTTGDAQSPPSENDAGERPVRKQLKETSIDSATTSSESRRKRSFDETRADAPEDPVDADTETEEGRRKRSRESSPRDAENTKIQTVSSPPSTHPISDPAKEEALEPVKFSGFYLDRAAGCARASIGHAFERAGGGRSGSRGVGAGVAEG